VLEGLGFRDHTVQSRVLEGCLKRPRPLNLTPKTCLQGSEQKAKLGGDEIPPGLEAGIVGMKVEQEPVVPLLVEGLGFGDEGGARACCATT
jgi:hypothetical protein